MSAPPDPAAETAEELFEDAPCGYLSCRPDGTIVRVNRTFEAWSGRSRDELVGRRFTELLTGAGRIYHETHYAPLLRMQGAVREIALEIVHRDGTRLPALINAVQHADAEGRAVSVRTTIFDAADRRSYEQELLEARRREQQIAIELQRSLLTGELPVRDGLDIEVHYRPAVPGLEAGGDWYDAFPLEDGRVALAIGDVVGRGITAAATMGQLRSAIRALASTGLGPGELLDALDRYSSRHGLGRMATIAYCELDEGTGALRYAAAGHPPPVVLAPGRAPRFLEEGRSVPLDAALRRSPRPEGEDRLAAGTRLVLYTDGLVERRSRPLSVGLDELAAVLAEDPGTALPALTRRLGADAHQDDVCVLAARLAG